MVATALYPFRFYDPIRRRWFRARYVARFEQIAGQSRPFQIIGPPELRESDDEAGGVDSGSHLQSSPAPSQSLPSDFGDGNNFVRSDSQGSARVGGDIAASEDEFGWGMRLLP